MKGVKRFVGHVESHVESGRGRLVRVGTTGVAVAAVLSLLLLPGCGKKESPAGSASSPAPAAAPATTPPAAAPAAQPAPAKAAKGEVTKDKLPADFPPDIPLPADLEPKTVFLAPGQGGLANFVSKSSGDAVVQELEQSLPGAGWTLKPTQKQPTRTLIYATKAARKLTVVVIQASGHSEITLSLQGG